MGNLAVKCETRWQERKNVGRGTADVRIMKADGSGVEEFDRPVVAAEVLYQFPDYVVVQWSPKQNTELGKRGQLRVLQPHEVLTSGEIYILFPIPVEVLKNKIAMARRTRRMQSAKDRLSMLLQRSGMGLITPSTEDSLQEQQQSLRGDENSGNGGRSEGIEDKMAQPSLEGFRGGAWQPNSPLDSSADKVDLAQKESSESESEEERLARVRDLYLSPCFASSNWRPALLSIPESPVGFHSRPGSRVGSPMRPIAFRLVSRSHLDVDTHSA